MLPSEPTVTSAPACTLAPPHSVLASAVQIGGLPVSGLAPASHGLVSTWGAGLGMEAKPRGEDMRESMTIFFW